MLKVLLCAWLSLTAVMGVSQLRSGVIEVQEPNQSIKVDVTASNYTVPKGLTNFTIQAAIFGTFTSSSQRSNAFLSIYFHGPGDSYGYSQFQRPSQNFTITYNKNYTIPGPITSNMTIKVFGYGWTRPSTDNNILSSAGDEQVINIIVKG